MKLTQKQLNVWHAKRHKLGGISANENWNESIGLPAPEVRTILRKIHDDKFGFLSGIVTLKMFEQYADN